MYKKFMIVSEFSDTSKKCDTIKDAAIDFIRPYGIIKKDFFILNHTVGERALSLTCFISSLNEDDMWLRSRPYTLEEIIQNVVQLTIIRLSLVSTNAAYENVIYNTFTEIDHELKRNRIMYANDYDTTFVINEVKSTIREVLEKNDKYKIFHIIHSHDKNNLNEILSGFKKGKVSKYPLYSYNIWDMNIKEETLNTNNRITIVNDIIRSIKEEVKQKLASIPNKVYRLKIDSGFDNGVISLERIY